MKIRHLKIRGKLLPPANTEVEVTIVEQTHVHNTFSRLGKSSEAYHHSGCFFYGTVIIIGLDGTSCFRAAAERSKLGGPIHYLMLGTNKSFTVPVQYWPDVKAAIEAYNKWGETREGSDG